MKKILKITLALLIVGFGIFGVSSIYAYLTDIAIASNVVIVGSIDIEINEIFEPPVKLEPGISFTKDVSITNTGISDCYVRIKAVYTDSDMGDYCTLDIDTENFIYNEKDNFYYYKNVLKQGEKSPSLFTTVTLSEAIKAEEIKDFDILIYAESFQASGFDDYKDAWKYYQRNDPTK